VSTPQPRGAGFNLEAPLVLRVEREIRASPSAVWDVLVAVDRWAGWHRGIRFAVLRGHPSRGTSLHWSADGLKLSSVLAEVEHGRRIGWTIRTLGGRGYQRWTLEETPSGGTRLQLDESWEGIAVRMLRGTLRRTLELSRAEWMRGLEAQSTGEAARGRWP
jgi:uncharacterized protein YndB with AHSA1/START domain